MEPGDWLRDLVLADVEVRSWEELLLDGIDETVYRSWLDRSKQATSLEDLHPCLAGGKSGHFGSDGQS